MTQYARYIDEHTVQYPTDSEFRGIPNWWEHDAALRKRDYVPMAGEPEPRLGATPEPSTFEYVQQTETRLVPEEVVVDDYDINPETGEREKTGSHREWQEREKEFDTSYIQITGWTWLPIPAPELPPLPTRFSKGTLLEALMANNLYDQAKAIYAADLDLQIAWAGFADIDLSYPATQSIMQQYPELFSEANVQMLLEWIRDNG